MSHYILFVSQDYDGNLCESVRDTGCWLSQKLHLPRAGWFISLGNMVTKKEAKIVKGAAVGIGIAALTVGTPPGDTSHSSPPQPVQTHVDPTPPAPPVEEQCHKAQISKEPSYMGGRRGIGGPPENGGGTLGIMGLGALAWIARRPRRSDPGQGR
jgi:hypothetical protein